jgi:aspartate kinase
MKIVMKFGGTSMAGAEKIRNSASLALAQAKEHAVVCVVSAMDGVTEQMLDLADAAAAGNRAGVLSVLAKVRADHEAAARTLGCLPLIDTMLRKLETLVEGIAAIGELTPRSKDAVVAYGERLSTALMGAAMACPAMDGYEAGIVTTDQFTSADPLMELSMFQVRSRVGGIVAPGKPVVVSGFIAGNQHGVTTTLGRGGSDYTATILGAALNADEIWIWSDVDGMMTADPRVVSGARLMSHITFGEAVEMGKFGAKSMHPRALEPAAESMIPVRMRNTFKPELPGTLIASTEKVQQLAAPRAGAASRPVLAVPALKNMTFITVGGATMIGRPGTAAAIFDALALARVNVHMICQSVSESGISIAVSAAQADEARSALERAIIGVLGERTARAIDVQRDVTIVACVGAAMRGTPGVAARVFTAIARAEINVLAIAQGSSELSIALAVMDKDGPSAVRALHAEFKLSDE